MLKITTRAEIVAREKIKEAAAEQARVAAAVERNRRHEEFEREQAIRDAQLKKDWAVQKPVVVSLLKSGPLRPRPVRDDIRDLSICPGKPAESPWEFEGDLPTNGSYRHVLCVPLRADGTPRVESRHFTQDGKVVYVPESSDGYRAGGRLTSPGWATLFSRPATDEDVSEYAEQIKIARERFADNVRVREEYKTALSEYERKRAEYWQASEAADKKFEEELSAWLAESVIHRLDEEGYFLDEEERVLHRNHWEQHVEMVETPITEIRGL